MQYRDLQKTPKALSRQRGISLMANGLESSEGLQAIPENHNITVSDRSISVDNSRLVQHNVNTDTMTLTLDGEWDGMNVVINLGEGEEAISLRWTGKPTVIPPQVAKEVGTIPVSVVGLDADGETRLVTIAAPSVFNVVKAGWLTGSIPEEEVPDLLGQLLEAANGADDAKKAALEANEIATEAAKTAQEASKLADETVKKINSTTAIQFGEGASPPDANGVMYLDTQTYDVYKITE